MMFQLLYYCFNYFFFTSTTVSASQNLLHLFWSICLFIYWALSVRYYAYDAHRLNWLMNHLTCWEVCFPVHDWQVVELTCMCWLIVDDSAYVVSQLTLFSFADCPYTLGWWGLVWIFSSSFTQVCLRGVSRSLARNGSWQVHLLCHSWPYWGLSPFACERIYHPFSVLYIILGELPLITSFPWEIIFAGSPLPCGQFGVSWLFLFWYNSHVFLIWLRNPVSCKISYLGGSIIIVYLPAVYPVYGLHSGIPLCDEWDTQTTNRCASYRLSFIGFKKEMCDRYQPGQGSVLQTHVG